MDIRVCDNPEELSSLAADAITTELRAHPALILGAATGKTPTRTYELFVEDLVRMPALTDQLRVVTIDELGGLDARDPATCEAYVRTRLVEPLRIDDGRFIHFSTNAASPEDECRRLGSWLAENGPMDLCVLGLGANGHIALVEPGGELPRGAHVATLSDASLGHSMLSASRARPTHGMTLGIDQLFGSRRILLLVSGAHKQHQLARLVEGPISTDFPASLLWFHANTTVLCDRAAGASIEFST